MKMENFRFMPILALLVCFVTDAFADRSNIKIVPADTACINNINGKSEIHTLILFPLFKLKL